MHCVTVLVVDDHEPFQRFIQTSLEQHAKFRVIGRAADGLEAIEKTVRLKPGLVLLDIGLPALDGLEVARRLRGLCPNSRIIFVSQESSLEVVEEALGVGAMGYVLKSGAARELLPAIEAVLAGERYFRSALKPRTASKQALSHGEVEFR